MNISRFCCGRKDDVNIIHEPLQTIKDKGQKLLPHPYLFINQRHKGKNINSKISKFLVICFVNIYNTSTDIKMTNKLKSILQCVPSLSILCFPQSSNFSPSYNIPLIWHTKKGNQLACYLKNLLLRIFSKLIGGNSCLA